MARSVAWPRLGRKFQQALRYVHRLHRGQYRKRTRIPYIGHLLVVAGLVLEYGGDEDLAIAALLHDAVEDQGGRKTLAQIRRRFGGRVASIVGECSDRLTVRKSPWRVRKETYLTHLRTASEGALLVSLADKVHNASTIVKDLHRVGDRVWSRFGGGKAGTLWYYRRLVDTFRQTTAPADLVGELARRVSQMHRLAR
ncbi:MAG: HD domain-containing protein [Armatimonadota bacterium]|nr:HD domain-containing protein [Armatimonadota bacterium]MDR7452540.1 HD domain-containing protein [Armatimonadota bacterium]MDR7467767.1 HD domain-containing protein [Armatimonadota bacterium]MDR7494967.1 HD domain-containing protein [Armatimonadota bacterium]MDR7499768.1 HD domain-containing protein [Armatimonadota bacterium]